MKRTLTRIVIPVTTAGLVAVGVTAVAVAAPNSAPNSASSKHGPGVRLLRHAMHGEFTVGKRDGSNTRVLDIQRGEITKVDKSAKTLTLKSPDGFTRTYVVNSETRIRSKGNGQTLSDLKSGERALVVAEPSGGTFTAKAIRVKEPH